MKYNYSNSQSVKASPAAVYEAIVLQVLPHYSRKKSVKQDEGNREVTIIITKSVAHHYRCTADTDGGTMLITTAHCDFGNLYNAGVLLPVYLPVLQYWLKPKVRKSIDQLAVAAKKFSESTPRG